MRKLGDIVLVKSPAGDAITQVHVKLLKRVVVKPRNGNNFDWPGYSGWEAELVFKEEADHLRKEWSIPFSFPDHIKTFVYDHCIVKKPRRPQPNVENKRKNKRRIVKKRK